MLYYPYHTLLYYAKSVKARFSYAYARIVWINSTDRIEMIILYSMDENRNVDNSMDMNSSAMSLE